ncbi:MAG: NAD-dependent epimerase/dehydratase family protein [Flavobacteriales bacterium]|nr:NAD-dependent epimerase/dehydratase family protein [Flavobacteriales bacterium]
MILVTGGTGFLGAHLLVQLTNEGLPVRAIKRSESSLAFVKQIFQLYATDYIKQWELIKWEEADLLDIFQLEDALEGVNQVYHCAGKVSFVPSARSELMAVNARGTANLVNVCLNIPNIRLCHVSSIAAIGRSRLDEVIAEDRFWKNDPNNSWYAMSKYQAEREVWRGIEEGLNAVIVNPAVILGVCNWQEGTGRMFSQVWNGLRFYTQGVTGWVDVNDVARAMILLMKSNIVAERYILSEGNHSYHEIFNLIADYLGKKRPNIKAPSFLTNLAWRIESLRSIFADKEPLITKESARTATLSCFYDNSKLIREFGFSYTPIETTIQNTARVYLKKFQSEIYY